MIRISVDLLAESMSPYLYSVELTPPIHCPLLRLQASCKKLRHLWSRADSSIAPVCIHCEDTIWIRGAIPVSDFRAYLETAMRSVVVHPCEICSFALSRIPQLQGLRRTYFPAQWACTMATTSALIQFTFGHTNIREFLHGNFDGVKRLCSTAHSISVVINGESVSLMDVSLCICYEPCELMTTEVRMIYDTDDKSDGSFTASVWQAEKRARVSLVIFGLEIANSENWIGSDAYDLSSGKWPQPPLWQFESEICESPGLGEALNLSLRSSEDLRFSCLVDIEVAMASSQFVMESLLVSRTSEDGYVDEA